jgi:hypothetical protein
VKRLAAGAITRKLTVDVRASALGTLEVLEHQHASTFADVHADARSVEGAARFRVH